MQDFRKIGAWQENRVLTVAIYRMTAKFPAAERFGLCSQMRRAVVSIGANMAEGCGRRSNADMLRFFQMSCGSAYELQHHLITSLDLEYLAPQDFDAADKQLESVRRLIAGFMRSVRRNS